MKLTVLAFLLLVSMPVFGARAEDGQSCEIDLKDSRGMKLGRGWETYKDFLRARKVTPLQEFIQNTPDGGVLMDLGSGLAEALGDIVEDRRSLGADQISKFVAVAYAKPKLNDLEPSEKPKLKKLNDRLKKFPELLQYVESGDIHKALLDPNSELSSYKGRVSRMIDVMGYIMYGEDLFDVLNDIATLLHVRGRALVYFGEHRLNLKYKGRPILFRDLRDLVPALTGGRLKVAKLGVTLSQNDASNSMEEVIEFVKISEGLNTPPQRLLKTKIEERGFPPVRQGQILVPDGILTIDRRKDERRYGPFDNNLPQIFHDQGAG